MFKVSNSLSFNYQLKDILLDADKHTKWYWQTHAIQTSSFEICVQKGKWESFEDLTSLVNQLLKDHSFALEEKLALLKGARTILRANNRTEEIRDSIKLKSDSGTLEIPLDFYKRSAYFCKLISSGMKEQVSYRECKEIDFPKEISSEHLSWLLNFFTLDKNTQIEALAAISLEKFVDIMMCIDYLVDNEMQKEVVEALYYSKRDVTGSDLDFLIGKIEDQEVLIFFFYQMLAFSPSVSFVYQDSYSEFLDYLGVDMLQFAQVIEEIKARNTSVQGYVENTLESFIKIADKISNDKIRKDFWIDAFKVDRPTIADLEMVGSIYERTRSLSAKELFLETLAIYVMQFHTNVSKGIDIQTMWEELGEVCSFKEILNIGPIKRNLLVTIVNRHIRESLNAYSLMHEIIANLKKIPGLAKNFKSPITLDLSGLEVSNKDLQLLSETFLNVDNLNITSTEISTLPTNWLQSLKELKAENAYSLTTIPLMKNIETFHLTGSGLRGEELNKIMRQALLAQWGFGEKSYEEMYAIWQEFLEAAYQKPHFYWRHIGVWVFDGKIEEVKMDENYKASILPDAVFNILANARNVSHEDKRQFISQFTAVFGQQISIIQISESLKKFFSLRCI